MVEGFVIPKIESMVDLITNSSTVVYIMFDGNIEEYFYNLFDEFCKANKIESNDIRDSLKIWSIPEIASDWHYERKADDSEDVEYEDYYRSDELFAQKVWLVDEEFRKYVREKLNDDYDNMSSDYLYIQYLSEDAKTKYHPLGEAIASLSRYIGADARRDG